MNRPIYATALASLFVLSAEAAFADTPDTQIDGGVGATVSRRRPDAGVR